jgi:ribosomal RNA-processing protein 1
MYAHVVLGCCASATGKKSKTSSVELKGETDTPAALKKAVLGRMLEVASADASELTAGGGGVGGMESNRRRIYALWREEGGGDDEDEDDE